MSTRHLSLRLESDTLDRLGTQSRQAGQTRSQLARTLIEEGLRMDAHPGIVFRPGPAGRRPALADGPDVWSVARVIRGVKGSPEEVVERTTKLTGLTREQVTVAVRYYADYRAEIDQWLRRLDEEAERQEAAWLRQQELLRR